MKTEVDFWENAYKTNSTGWDLGEVSPPLKKIINHLEDQELKILIPGAGNAYEAEYLFKKGFKNTHVVDVSKLALNNLKHRCPEFPHEQILNLDFFKLDMEFDLILEQTFFCAIHPSFRKDYAKQMANLLSKGKQLLGVLFNFQLSEKGPPYGGSKDEYLAYFQPYFNIDELKECKTSHPSRAGKELILKLTRL